MRPKPKCVHCLEQITTDQTRDHVFPTSWYPNTTPTKVQRWTVPSCSGCNGTFGELEKELFIRLAICVDPTKAEASGISKDALRSMGVGVQDLDPEERAHRTALLKKVLGDSVPLKDIGDVPLVPGLGPHVGFSVDQQRAVTIPDDLLKRVAGKILRGCEYKLNKKAYVEEPYRLEIYLAHDNDVSNLTAVFETLQATTLGPGFEVRRGESTPGESHTVLYRVTIWGTIKIYASISRDENLKPSPTVAAAT
jgi:hypothetical protein